jgi:prepilin-type N-terminal cleavage/methylation domain-containing protein
MKKQQKQAFTLVELIIVITILAILATIGFMSYQSYTLDARDGKRTTDLTQIRNWLEMYKAKKVTYPKHTANTTANIWTLIIQWYVDSSVLWAIKISNDSIDPLEKLPYTYSTNTNYTKYQLLAYLENGESLNLSSSLNKAYAVNNYQNRKEYVLWDKLWVVLDNSTSAPIQEIQTWSIDLSGTYSWTTFKLIVDNTSSWNILSTWSTLETTITENTWNNWTNTSVTYEWVSSW